MVGSISNSSSLLDYCDVLAASPPSFHRRAIERDISSSFLEVCINRRRCAQNGFQNSQFQVRPNSILSSDSF